MQVGPNAKGWNNNYQHIQYHIKTPITSNQASGKLVQLNVAVTRNGVEKSRGPQTTYLGS